MPQYEGLTIESITRYLSGMPECHPYFPVWKEVRKLPKQWIVNVAASVLGEPFVAWVANAIRARNEKVAVERDVMINVDPEIARAFEQSTAVSSKSSFFINSQLASPFLFLHL